MTGLRVGRLAAPLAVAVVVLAACTTVPISSKPDTIERVPVGQGSDTVFAPPPNVTPRDLVSAFLAANAAESGGHASARLFLTPAARNKWSDTTVTIIDGESTGTYEAGHSIQVTGRVVGTINAAGIYTPSLQGTGDGGTDVQFPYTVKRVRGQYRIDTLRNGLVITNEQFQRTYQRRTLYFFDADEHYLVPDPRWTALTNPSQLANWLISQLADGPRPELQNGAVSTDTLPAQANTRRLQVTLGSPTQVEIPGAAQLDVDGRDRLAAQVGQTLDQAVPGGVLAITDGGTPVRIQQVGSAQFSASSFSDATGPPAPSPDVYYLRSGRVIVADGKQLTGRLGDGSYFLTSIALARTTAGGPLIVAGVAGSGPGATLMVGTQPAGLAATAVRGVLSRPAWAPGRDEVWIGDGPKLYRVITNGRVSHASKVSVPSAAGGGRIVAVRLSPDGSRIGIVVAGASGSAQLYVGSVDRGTGQVRVDTLDPISPEDVVVTDLAWIDSLQLYAIGHNTGTPDARIFETGADGSLWFGRDISGLPGAPDSLTEAANQLAWVSANGAVWVQNGSTWTSAGVEGQTPGLAPIYLE